MLKENRYINREILIVDSNEKAETIKRCLAKEPLKVNGKMASSTFKPDFWKN